MAKFWWWEDRTVRGPWTVLSCTIHQRSIGQLLKTCITHEIFMQPAYWPTERCWSLADQMIMPHWVVLNCIIHRYRLKYIWQRDFLLQLKETLSTFFSMSLLFFGWELLLNDDAEITKRFKGVCASRIAQRLTNKNEIMNMLTHHLLCLFSWVLAPIHKRSHNLLYIF